MPRSCQYHLQFERVLGTVTVPSSPSFCLFPESPSFLASSSPLWCAPWTKTNPMLPVGYTTTTTYPPLFHQGIDLAYCKMCNRRTGSSPSSHHQISLLGISLDRPPFHNAVCCPAKRRPDPPPETPGTDPLPTGNNIQRARFLDKS